MQCAAETWKTVRLGPILLSYHQNEYKSLGCVKARAKRENRMQINRTADEQIQHLQLDVSPK